MSNLLLVPIQIDALCLDKDQLAVESKADFSLLPFQNLDGVDQNSASINLSDAILSHEFQNLNFTLKKGIHLHWALPDGLTMGAQDDNNQVVYPQMPNRWLVSKYSNGALESQWIVESDYLHPQGKGNDYDSVSYPIDINDYASQVIPANADEDAYQPYRFIGRQITLDEWDENEQFDRLKYLSVAGYGESSFAAFYPNCHSILGFKDESETDTNALSQIEYSVIGWYSDSNDDPLNDLIKNNPNATIEEVATLIQQEFNWEIKQGLTSAPNNIVCFGNITFKPSDNIVENTQVADVEIAIGNSGKEALAAYMATKFHADNKKNAEEQLMAIQLSSMVNSGSTDVGPSFQKAFHDDQFSSSDGQTVWVVSLQSNSSNTVDNASQKNKDENIQLPPGLIDQINDLNLVQEKFEKANDQIQFLRHALFSDWYKYMTSAYPSSDEINSYPDMNLIKYYIENKSIKDLENLIAETGEILYVYDSNNKYVTDIQANQANTFAAQVTVYFQQLYQSVDHYNSGKPSATYFTALCNQGTLPTGVTADENITWAVNLPTTDQCLQFFGSNYLTYNISADDNCRAISFWVKVNAQQPNDAVLINIDSAINSALGVSGFGALWNKVFIDGVQVNPEINKDWSTIPKDKWVHIYLESASVLSGNLFIFSLDGSQNFANGQLTSFRLFNRAISIDDIYTDRNIFLKNQAIIQQTTGGKYFQGNEPIILFSGNDVKPSLRHGFDGMQHEEDLLSCDALDDFNVPISKSDVENLSLLTYIQDNKPKQGEESIGYQFWEQPPWNPFMFEWETELFPMIKGNELVTSGGNYQSSFIEENYQQEMNQEALVAASNAQVSENALVYTGYTIITNQAQVNLQSQVIIFLNNQLSSDYTVQFGAALDTTENQDSFNAWYANKVTITETNFSDFTDWIAQYPFEIPSNLSNNIISQAIGAYTEVTELNIQSQSLGGFNQALLMFSQELQIPISDTLGFKDGKTLAKSVADLVLNKNNSVAHPLNTFMPLRTGNLKINRIRLVDTFGQIKDVENLDELIVPESMSYSSDSSQLYLPPTITQPSRIDFRWLSADKGEQEVNSAQNSNPICGWLLPNFMDLSIMVYDQNGFSLGYIDLNAVWQPTPGDSTPLDPEYISNPYLKKVVKRLCILSGETDTTKATYVNDFINMMAEALVNISPANYAQQQGTAIIMGRPLAVVRCSLNLEVKGNVAFNQSWNTFRIDLNTDERTTNEFEKVQIPLRVGDRGQLNDGVVGYWKENTDTTLSDAFYTTIKEGVVSNDNIVSFETDPTHLQQSIVSPTQLLTMIIDPNGLIHAHSGMVPTKSISIPSNKFANALKNINITFLSTPIITPKDLVELSLPNEAGFNWSWVAKQGQIWKQVGGVGTVTINDFTTKFSNGLDIWNALVSNNWITTQDNATALIVAEDQRTTSDLGGAFSTQLIEIQNILDQSQINPFDFEGNFKSKVEAIEGWLKLSPQ